MNTRTQIVLSVSLVAVAALVLVVGLRRGGAPQAADSMEGHDHAAMSATSGEPKPVVLDGEAARRIGVAYATVERKILTRYVSTVGNVVYDETRLSTVNPRSRGGWRSSTWTSPAPRCGPGNRSWTCTAHSSSPPRRS